MKLSKIVAGLSLSIVAATANAAFSVDGITVPDGLTFETITLFEGEDLSGAGNGNRYIDQVGEKLLGVGIVNQILDSNNNVVWANGQNGKELTFVISGFTADTLLLPDPTRAQVQFSGGSIKLYSQAAGTLNTGAGTQAAAVASASSGNLWLDLVGSALGGQTTLGNNITLATESINLTGGNPFTASTNLTGQGLLDVAGGLAALNFDTNQFGCVASDGSPCPDDADLKFTSSGQLNAPGVGGPWGFRGTGEVQSFAVPEPGSLALVGAAFLGMGAAASRRRARKG